MLEVHDCLASALAQLVGSHNCSSNSGWRLEAMLHAGVLRVAQVFRTMTLPSSVHESVYVPSLSRKLAVMIRVFRLGRPAAGCRVKMLFNGLSARVVHPLCFGPGHQPEEHCRVVAPQVSRDCR